MNNDKDPRRAAREATRRTVDELYNQAYTLGFESVRAKARSDADRTTLIPATDEEKARWSWFGLEWFCDKCRRGLDAEAAEFEFCPHCGRAVTRTEKPDVK